MEFLHNMSAYFEQFGAWGLFINSFVESFFLVPPPDFVLIALDLLFCHVLILTTLSLI